MKIKLQTIKCLRCGYEWTPRGEKIVRCANPKCRSVYFDVPKKDTNEKKELPVIL